MWRCVLIWYEIWYQPSEPLHENIYSMINTIFLDTFWWFNCFRAIVVRVVRCELVLFMQRADNDSIDILLIPCNELKPIKTLLQTTNITVISESLAMLSSVTLIGRISKQTARPSPLPSNPLPFPGVCGIVKGWSLAYPRLSRLFTAASLVATCTYSTLINSN